MPSQRDMLFRECQVLSVDDDKGALRIKVRLDPEDNYKELEDIPYCFPLLPKHFHINPKEGEMVLVLLSKLGSSNSKRWFIGPIVSQQYGLNNENFLTAQSILENGRVTLPLPNPDLNPENKGSYPDREDIAIQGRNNADIIFKQNELRIRCGFKKNVYSSAKDSLIFNRENLAYMQIKYKTLIDHRGKSFSSTINLVADKINLLSHDSRTPFTLNNPTSLITDEELLRILKDAHPLPYGDKLINFLKLFIEVFRTHTHSFPQDPPVFKTTDANVLNTDLNEMLSSSIRIN